MTKIFCALLFFAITNLSFAGEPALEDGDIIFQRSMGRQAEAIAAATRSEHTHVGMVFHDDGVPYVYEAVQPVKKTLLVDWVKRGKEGKFVVRRLIDRSAVDTEELKREVVRFLGRDYDAQFGWSDAKIYCSELVWKAYERSSGIEIGKLRQLKEYDLEHETVRKLVVERYGDRVPLDMKVIAPSDLFASPLCTTVATEAGEK
ncbi:MAG: YiiX family permuted papain-like enzyme [Luteolibacter sp.]